MKQKHGAHSNGQKRSSVKKARADGRTYKELRPVSFEIDAASYAEGSVLVRMGKTRVLCNATVQDGMPPWMRNQEKPGGWITAEYSMLPRATHTRNQRETRGLGGRTQEIQRLIGRALRASCDLKKLGERTIIVDCDVLQADGGTRTASITGGYVALRLALMRLIAEKKIAPQVFLSPVAAVSVGIVRGRPALDLCYIEDSSADADMNIVMNGRGELIEVQGTAEAKPFTKSQFKELLLLAERGVEELLAAQKAIYSSR